MSKRSTNPAGTEIVNRYVVRWKALSSAALARKIWRENKLCFTSVEAVRSAIRYRRGAVGKANRLKVGLSCSTVTPASKYNPLNPLELPASDEKLWTPFQMDGCKKVLVISDLHLPYHNLAALTCAIQNGQREGVDGVLINGDLCDFHGISRFVVDPKKKDFKAERRIQKQFLARLRELFPKARIVFKEGNHDERLWNYLAPRIPDLFEDEEIQKILGLPVLLGLAGFGIEHVAEKREVMLGRLPVLHGHEFRAGFAPPVNPARGAFLKAKESVMVSHHHKTSEHTETTLGRKIITTWSLGCLCELRPAYDPFNGNNHGFAVVELGKAGSFHVFNKRILDGKIL